MKENLANKSFIIQELISKRNKPAEQVRALPSDYLQLDAVLCRKVMRESHPIDILQKIPNYIELTPVSPLEEL